MCVCVVVWWFSCVQLLQLHGLGTYQAPLSMGFSRQEYWSGYPFPSPGDLPDPGIKPGSPALQLDSLPTELQGKPVCVCVCMYVLVAQLCLTLCTPLDCSPPGSSVHGILQERILEWVVIPFSSRSSPPRNQTQVSCALQTDSLLSKP